MAELHKLLVNGFIHRMESILKDENNINALIPVEVIAICYQFYFTPIISKLMYISNQEFISLNIYNHIIDTNNIIKCVQDPFSSTTYRKKFNVRSLSSPFCYIPNIWHSLSLPNIPLKFYDGIMATHMWSRRHCQTKQFPSLLLFDPSDTSNNIQYYTYSSTIPFMYNPAPNPGVISYLNCGEKHGIIAEINDGKLYQIKLENIISKQYSFTQLKTSIIWHNFNYKQNQLKMVYLNGNQSIFAINCANETRTISLECGILDLNSNKWKLISNFENKYFPGMGFSRYGICCDYNENNVYVVSDMGFVHKYNFHKNKWIMLSDNSNPIHSLIVRNEEPVVWFDKFDNNTLYYSDVRTFKPRFGYFDVRTRVSKWNEIKSVKPYDKHRCINVF
eukprot:419456_1